MVEMSETAYILRNATAKSLIILDEIGRGTSTFDGLAIAWAVVEYLCDKQKVGAKTLFATHYHELSELEGHVEGVQNYCISVKEHGEDVIFLRKIVRGGADKSFGIHVARLAGVPHPVLVRAHEIQARLEVSDVNKIGQNILGEGEKPRENEQVNLFEVGKTEIINELQSLDVMALTPMDAINKLFLLRKRPESSKALPHNSSAALAMPFLPSASCRNLDLPPVNLRFLQSHLTKNAFAIAPTHLCGIALRDNCKGGKHVRGKDSVVAGRGHWQDRRRRGRRASLRRH